MSRRDHVVELISAMTDALYRNDEGDMDCPAWENVLRLEPLRAQLRSLSRSASERSAGTAPAQPSGLEGAPAS
jgi:hypothetical protein